MLAVDYLSLFAFNAFCFVHTGALVVEEAEGEEAGAGVVADGCAELCAGAPSEGLEVDCCES